MRALPLFLVIASTVAYAQPMTGPAPEVPATPPPKLDLPALPKFDLPPGQLSVKRAHVELKRYLDTRITLHGYITFAYDCVADIRKPGESDRAVRKRIDDDPTLCERPKFYIGDARATAPEHSLWVVDVPRVYNKLELERIRKSERTTPGRCEPDEKDPSKKICPPYRDGDEVIVVGTFALQSPHSERDSDGLLVYEAMRNVTQGWQTPGATFEPTAVTDSGLAPPAPASLPRLARPPELPIGKDAKARSLQYLNTGNQALQNGDLARARADYQLATGEWAGNHLAWYGLGLAGIKANAWSEASAALDHAVSLLPDNASYQQFAGVARFELAVAQAREAQARKLGRAPSEIDPDLSGVHFDDARLHLRYAVQLEPHLWRSHYYLGRIARAERWSPEAAREFAEAIRGNPAEWAPYVALTELLRRWQYSDEAVAVASQGAQHVTPANSEVYYVLGMAYEDKPDDKAAIDAFGKALDADPINNKARFQRGQAYFHAGDYAHAKDDLEVFVKVGGSDPFARTQAMHMLEEIAAKPKRRR